MMKIKRTEILAEGVSHEWVEKNLKGRGYIELESLVEKRCPSKLKALLERLGYGSDVEYYEEEIQIDSVDRAPDPQWDSDIRRVKAALAKKRAVQKDLRKDFANMIIDSMSSWIAQMYMEDPRFLEEFSKGRDDER
jgi:hypothetical protein